ncbi:hypothetical protein SAMN05421812_101281 [Asanoa hainanensis]|uniref:NACHT N-terminal Helical domain-containing protein n=1 Tax=Asanoa hainanensis TaxID=560556 RepID=A0A239G929_9ACTN|nr:hypothetical protein [Asanoa hainanensis]SNS65601.1 hypothetical protein SAMN05421812_101281 [Asanoa hainanensis]
MPRSLSFADAVRLLGGQDSKVVGMLETAAGWLMAGFAPFVGDVLGWFDYKAELGRLSQKAVRDFYERSSGLADHGRLARIEAAHTVIVIGAFFEGLRGTPLPVKITKREQIALGTNTAAMPDAFVTQIMAAGRLIPAEGQSTEDFRSGLRAYYANMVEVVDRFLDGLAAVEQLSNAQREQLSETLRAAADRALVHYQDSLLELVAVFRDVAFWAEGLEHRAMQSTLDAVHAGRAPDQRRAGLAAAHADGLRARATDLGTLPAGIKAPSLKELYVPPMFRVMAVTGPDLVSDEEAWEACPSREDPVAFLKEHLATDKATRAPLYVVGDLGTGKTAFTRVFAAQLSAENYLVVRVVLRDRPDLDDIQKRIEQAITDATGSDVGWQGLVESAKDAVTVVAFDAFDELLQATDLNQADFLEKVAAFQSREAGQHRPVAAVVTSRTDVADQARIPDETVAIRLEPFGPEQVDAWIAGWNAVNAAAPLAPEPILAQRDLVELPLALGLLAAYTAGEQRSAAPHEHLIKLVSAREVAKYRPGRSPRDLDSAVEKEVALLAGVALSTFQRADRWITEIDLDRHLVNAGAVPEGPGSDTRMPLRRAERVFGRFPFRRRRHAYAFTYSSFADVLVARLVWNALLAVATDQKPTEPVPSDRGPRELLSVRLLTHRRAVLDFLTEMATELTPSALVAVRRALVRMFRAVPDLPAARYATYRANLVLLLVWICGSVRASELFDGTPDVIGGWRAQARLWESQLPAASLRSLLDELTVDRDWEGGVRDLRIGPARADWVPGPVDPGWSFAGPGGALAMADDVRVLINFRCDPVDDLVLFAAGSSIEAIHGGVRAAASDGLALDARLRLVDLLLNQIGVPGHLAPDEAAEVIESLHGSVWAHLPTELRSKMVLCALAHLDHGASDDRIAGVLQAMLLPDLADVDAASAALVLVRLVERGLPPPSVAQLASRELFDAFVFAVEERRPDLARRLAPLAPAAPPHHGEAG